MSEVIYWRGEPLADMTRAELIGVIHELAEREDRQRAEHKRRLDFLLATKAPPKRKPWWRW